ncbi:MAG: sulfur carrier protein ThiS [Candidatus Lernaella stagnicola]|nr:sulfur carrier protein ThiS [Candidatus Lernaella stagnicola]
MPRLTVNGEAHQFDGVKTIAAMLEVMNILRENLVVEHNGEVIQPDKYETTAIRDGDTLELVRFVGGG